MCSMTNEPTNPSDLLPLELSSEPLKLFTSAAFVPYWIFPQKEKLEPAMQVGLPKEGSYPGMLPWYLSNW